ncbi:MAG TPA: tetratricopeptide repeat protein [Candidatus Cryosericum sp.]|nr:tetratricopeptide repeat protein [Candidatus Cryosericum sp.]
MSALDRAKTIQAAEKHVRAGKFLEAVAEYKKLADDNPRDMNVLNKLGDLLTRAGKNQEALRFFLRIAEFYAKDGFFLKAIAMYKKISKLDGTNLECQQQLAALYQKQGLASEAKAQYLLIADQLIRKGQQKAAADILQKVLEIEPDNVKVRSTLGELLGRSPKGDGAAREFCQAARSALDRGAAIECVQALRKAIHADPMFAELPAALLALIMKVEMTPKDLAPLAEAVSKAAPKNGVAVVVLAESYRRAGRKAEAETVFKSLEGIRQQDLTAEAMSVVARWHTGAGRDTEAYEWLNKSVERFVVEDRFADAAVVLDAYLQGHPVHRLALASRAAVAGRSSDADGEAEALLRLVPLLIEDLEPEKASEAVDKLETLRPGDAGVMALRARLQPPAADSESDAGQDEVPSAVSPSQAEEETGSTEGIFELGDDGLASESVAEEPLIAVAGAGGVEEESIDLPEEDAYGPVSRIQEIQAADGDGQPIDEEFISEHLTEAEVFVKYGLLAKAREQLQAILERYPKEMTAHERLIEVHAGEGNIEQAVSECLLLADLKKAAGLDGEVRELVNEAIRIAGPGGSPLIERYTAALDSGGALAGSVAKAARVPAVPAKAAPPQSPAPKSPRPAAPAHEIRPAPQKEAEPKRTPTPVSRPPAVHHPDSLEIEIDMPEEASEQVPAAAPVPDFAVTTARSTLLQRRDRVEEETPEEAPPRGVSRATAVPVAQLEIDEPAGDDGPTPLSPIATAKPREPDSEKLGEVDFYMEQGLTEEARQVLFQLRKQYPGSQAVAERLRGLEQPAGHAAAKAAATAPEANLDFEVEQALGGRPVAQEPQKKAAPPIPKGTKARPVFKVERHDPAEGGEFFDLAKELDASLGEEQGRSGTQAPDSLEGPGHSFDEVLAAFRKGVEQQVDEQDYDTHYNLGIAYKEMGLVDEAIGEFQFAARDPARTIECCGILGLCFRDRGMPDLALKWYRRGLDMPDLDEQKAMGLRYDMAEVYKERGEFEQALRMYTEVYGVDSNYRDVSARIKEVKGHLTSATRR